MSANAIELFIRKYTPRSLSEIAGNEDAKAEIKKWALEADRGKKVPPLLLYGAVGVGKSAAAAALVNEMNWEILETNASDLRDAETLKKIYGMSSSTGGLYGEKRLILIDEIDSVSDRQEYSALQDIIKSSSQPIMLIANDIWNQKLATIRFGCKQVEMKKINSASIRKKLIEIHENESGQKITEKGFDKFDAIAKNASGDIRSAINDLQAAYGMEEYASEKFSRDRDENIFEAVRAVLKTTNYKEAVSAGDDYNTQEGEMLQLWLEENIPLEYEKIEEQACAYHWLSRADVFMGRIKNRQHWGFLKYVSHVGKAGIALSKNATYHKFVKYQFPSAIKLLGQTKKNRGLQKSINKKVAAKVHTSLDDAKNTTALLSFMDGFFEYFDLSEDESSLTAELQKHKKHEERKSRKK